jgi:hypothetical protein
MSDRGASVHAASLAHHTQKRNGGRALRSALNSSFIQHRGRIAVNERFRISKHIKILIHSFSLLHPSNRTFASNTSTLTEKSTMVYQMNRSSYTLALLVLGMLQGSAAFTTRCNAFALDRSACSVGPNTSSTRLVSRTSTYQLPEEFQTQFPRPTMTDSISETRGAFGRLTEGLGNVLRFDKEKFAKVGVSFALTYSFVSNVNGSMSLSVAWYMASMRVSERMDRVEDST